MSAASNDLVVFLKSDLDNPKNWSPNKKILVCAYISSLSFCALVVYYQCARPLDVLALSPGPLWLLYLRAAPGSTVGVSH